MPDHYITAAPTENHATVLQRWLRQVIAQRAASRTSKLLLCLRDDQNGNSWLGAMGVDVLTRPAVLLKVVLRLVEEYDRCVRRENRIRRLHLEALSESGTACGHASRATLDHLRKRPPNIRRVTFLPAAAMQTFQEKARAFVGHELLMDTSTIGDVEDGCGLSGRQRRKLQKHLMQFLGQNNTEWLAKSLPCILRAQSRMSSSTGYISPLFTLLLAILCREAEEETWIEGAADSCVSSSEQSLEREAMVGNVGEGFRDRKCIELHYPSTQCANTDVTHAMHTDANTMICSDAVAVPCQTRAHHTCRGHESTIANIVSMPASTLSSKGTSSPILSSDDDSDDMSGNRYFTRRASREREIMDYLQRTLAVPPTTKVGTGISYHSNVASEECLQYQMSEFGALQGIRLPYATLYSREDTTAMSSLGLPCCAVCELECNIHTNVSNDGQQIATCEGCGSLLHFYCRVGYPGLKTESCFCSLYCRQEGSPPKEFPDDCEIADRPVGVSCSTLRS